jgi:hypothetical protein
VITGQYTGGELWTDAVRYIYSQRTCSESDCLQNTLEDLHNLMLADQSMTFDQVADASYIGLLAHLGSSTIWKSVLGGSNDDAQVRE